MSKSKSKKYDPNDAYPPWLRGCDVFKVFKINSSTLWRLARSKRLKTLVMVIRWKHKPDTSIRLWDTAGVREYFVAHLNRN